MFAAVPVMVSVVVNVEHLVRSGTPALSAHTRAAKGAVVLPPHTLATTLSTVSALAPTLALVATHCCLTFGLLVQSLLLPMMAIRGQGSYLLNVLKVPVTHRNAPNPVWPSFHHFASCMLSFKTVLLFLPID